MRALPDFIVIGGQKCGTTSLYEYLRQHPGISSNITDKEVHFFDEKFHRGINWYRSNFPIKQQGQLYFEASPYYIFHPLAPERVHQVLPNIKLIAILRNPTERAFSHYQHQVRTGREDLDFEQALQQEAQRLQGEDEKIIKSGRYKSFNHRKYSYIARGHYLLQLQRWLHFFDREQLMILTMEAFLQEPQRWLDAIFKFLGVEPIKISTKEKHNLGGYTSKMSPELKIRLDEIFAEGNDQLAEWLGRELKWE